MRIHHLHCGSMCPLGRRLFNGDGSLLARGELCCHCLLIEAADRLILVDTGLGTQDRGLPLSRFPGPVWLAVNWPNMPLEQTAIEQVKRLGFDPADVREIVLTHLDFDHAGGLSDFPHARVHVMLHEHEAAMARDTAMNRYRYAPRQWAHKPNWMMHETIGDTWHGFKSVRALPGRSPEVLLVPLTGHSRGHAGIAVRTPGGWLLHCGDAYFHTADLDSNRQAPLGIRTYENVFQFDRQARVDNQERLQELKSKHGQQVRLICSHDLAELHACPATEPAASTEPPAAQVA